MMMTAGVMMMIAAEVRRGRNRRSMVKINSVFFFAYSNKFNLLYCSKKLLSKKRDVFI